MTSEYREAPSSFIASSFVSVASEVAQPESDDAIECELVAKCVNVTKSWFHMVPLHPENLLFVLYWVGIMPEAYFTALRAKRPFALALLSYWILPLYNVKAIWYLERWPRPAIEMILATLDGEDWTERMTWMRLAIGL